MTIKGVVRRSSYRSTRKIRGEKRKVFVSAYKPSGGRWRESVKILNPKKRGKKKKK